MDDFDYGQISPGVRDIVRFLRGCGYNTTDSGDGSNYADGMGGALPFRHVMGTFVSGCLKEFADTMKSVLESGGFSGYRVEVSYSPGEPSVFMVLEDR